MSFLKRFFPDYAGPNQRELPRLLAMMGLFFLVVCSVGILRPIKNALALDGLGDTDFFKVYLVSAVVIFFVPIYNKLADRFPWRWLIPAVAVSFAIELVVFRVLYVEGSLAFGLIFYGWYDLFAAALVTQFFMATQLFFNARSAKQAYPLVIAGGSLGATLGGGITGFFSESVGTENLMLVAAALITLFALTLPLVWGAQPPPQQYRRNEPRKIDTGELRSLFRNRQVRLIAVSVLITILVKQLVDYQYNTMTKEVFQDLDAMSAFQGKFNAVTQWLPMLSLALLQPLMKRYGVGLAVLILPFAMLATNIGLEIWWGLWATVAAKGAETSLRYSTERAAREILYVPVPEEIKLKAKAYIDVAIEKGVGKVLSAGMIALLLLMMGYRQLTLVGIALSLIWLISAFAMRREYLVTLAHSIEGRFASLRGSFASLGDASTSAAVRRALSSGDPLQVAFALDLVSQAATGDLEALSAELYQLLEHPSDAVREKALQALARDPARLQRDRIRGLTRDASSSVREAAVAALCAGSDAQATVEELLRSQDHGERTAALACLGKGVVSADAARVITRDYIAGHMRQVRAGDLDARLEVALAAGLLGHDPDAVAIVAQLAGDQDARVANAALLSAGQLGDATLYPLMIEGLTDARTRSAARRALAMQGASVADVLIRSLLDARTPNRVRRQIPAVLSHIPTAEATRGLLRSYLAPETDELLDFRSLKALGKLRAQHPELPFNREDVLAALRREVEAANRYVNVKSALPAQEARGAVIDLLQKTLDEAWSQRRESVFRLLGLLFAPAAVKDCYNAIHTANGRARANATEWLEATVGAELFSLIEPVLSGPGNGALRPRASAATPAILIDDNDAWLAHLARRAGKELNIRGAQLPAHPEDRAMDPIEKVFLLQQVDLLQGARSSHLALLASIANEVDVGTDHVLLQLNEPTTAMYIVVRGSVELRTTNDQIMVARDQTAFGTWALIDRAPSLLTARTTEPTRVLCIERDDFDDLLNENPELALGLLQGLARRVRTLVA
ncbi:MAG: Npt1/Npt2 family nucleotide transporter [Gemmatimonadota bacterium]